MHRTKPVVAAAQYGAEPGALAANVSCALEMTTRAAESGADLVVLPECCLSGYDLEWIRQGAPGGGSPLPGPILEPLLALGNELAIAVVVNELERAHDGLFSATVVLDGGQVVGMHRKSVITPAEEDAGLRAGHQAAMPVTVAGLPLPVAPMVCFEHGFPEIALDLALAGAGLIAISSAIATGTEYLRELRTRARAQDNAVYVVAANAVGNGFCGGSMIVDPRGTVLARGSADQPDLVVASIDPELIERQRRAEPVLQRRRPELRRR